MLDELKHFWSRYSFYKLHPDDEKYLINRREKYCLDLTIDQLRIQYGNDLRSDQTDAKFRNIKSNRSKILSNLLAHPFLGDVENASIYILMNNPGFSTSDYIDEIENTDYVELVEKNLKFNSECFFPIHENAKNTGGFNYWTQKGRIKNIVDELTLLNNKSNHENFELVKKSICLVESIAYHSCNKPNDELYNLPSSLLTKRFVNEYVFDKVKNKQAMCFVWRSASFFDLKKHKNIIIRSSSKAQGRYFYHEEVKSMARFLYLLNK